MAFNWEAYILGESNLDYIYLGDGLVTFATNDGARQKNTDDIISSLKMVVKGRKVI